MRPRPILLLCFLLLPWTLFGEFSLTEEESQFVSGLPRLRVMVDDDFAPFSSWNEAKAVYEGIAVDLFKESAAKLRLNYEFVHDASLTWAQKVDRFQSRDIDILLPVSQTPDRVSAGLFTRAYYETVYVAVAPEAAARQLSQAASLASWNVGAVASTSIVPYVKAFQPEDRLFLFPTSKALYQALREGRVDFALQSLPVFNEDRYDQELFDLGIVRTLEEWPRRYSFYFTDTPAMARLVPLFDRALSVLDVDPLVSRYGKGAEALIHRYTDQKQRQDVLLVILGAVVASVILLGLIVWNQRRLKESEARFRVLSEATFAGIAIHENAVILECNQALCDMTGYARGELIGMNGLDLLTPESRETVLTNIRSGTATSYEVEGQRKDGTRFTVGVRGKNIPYRGRPVRVTEFLDLTGPKGVEAAIRRAKQQYDDLVSKIPMGIYLLRSRPDLSFTFEFVSPRMSDILGYSVEELLADPLNAFHAIAAEERAAFDALNHRSLSTGVPFDWTGTARRGEESRWFHISSTSEKQDNGDLLWHGTLVDITEQKLIELKVEALLEEKEMLLKEVHHRIKNNMSTVSGLLTLQGATLDDPAAVQALEDAKGRVLTMMVLYDKLYMSVDNQAVSLDAYLPSLVEQVLGNFPNVGAITYSTRAEDIVLDARTLSSLGIIVNELLTNVMKYAFLGRESGSVAVSAVRRGNTVVVSVEDDGRGLPEGFDPAQSTGFGLSLVDMLIKHLKGTLSVERGHGTRFVLEFPAA